MPKSKKRGGQKAHNKRVQRRKQTLQAEQKRISNIWNEEMMKEIERLRAELPKQEEGENASDNTTPIME
jgi:uncharacterized small protein (DUF1192 family)